jgi:hypothetical protein
MAYKKATFLMVGIGSFAAALAGGLLADVKIEGKLATNDVIVRGGKTYVPLADVAKALGLTVQKTATGYDLVKAGGANQVEGVNGKIGEELFNGRYRFKVVSITRTDSYKPQFSGSTYDITPSSPSNEVVAVVCRIKNGTTESQTIDLLMGEHTALTDMSEQAYECSKGASVDVINRGPKLIPGSAVDFALIFEVPKTAVLKDLVYSLNDFSMKKQDFRVSLKKEDGT